MAAVPFTPRPASAQPILSHAPDQKDVSPTSTADTLLGTPETPTANILSFKVGIHSVYQSPRASSSEGTLEIPSTPYLNTVDESKPPGAPGPNAASPRTVKIDSSPVVDVDDVLTPDNLEEPSQSPPGDADLCSPQSPSHGAKIRSLEPCDSSPAALENLVDKRSTENQNYRGYTAEDYSASDKHFAFRNQLNSRPDAYSKPAYYACVPYYTPIYAQVPAFHSAVPYYYPMARLDSQMPSTMSAVPGPNLTANAGFNARPAAFGPGNPTMAAAQFPSTLNMNGGGPQDFANVARHANTTQQELNKNALVPFQYHIGASLNLASPFGAPGFPLRMAPLRGQGIPLHVGNAQDVLGPEAKIFVGNLPSHLTDAHILDRLSQLMWKYGPNYPKIVRAPSGNPIAFVQFHDEFSAIKAMGHARGASIGSRRIRTEPVKFATTFTLVRRDSMEYFSVEEAYQVANSHGHVLNLPTLATILMATPTGYMFRQGFDFVFATPDMAKQAYMYLNCKESQYMAIRKVDDNMSIPPPEPLMSNPPHPRAFSMVSYHPAVYQDIANGGIPMSVVPSWPFGMPHRVHPEVFFGYIQGQNNASLAAPR